MMKDKQAVSKGFEVVSSGYEYYKKFVRNIHVVVYDISWTDMEWQVKLMEHDGGVYFAQKEIGRYKTLEEALKVANQLNPDELESLINADDNDEWEEET